MSSTCPATLRQSPHRRRTTCPQWRRWPPTATRGRWESQQGWVLRTDEPMWHCIPPRSSAERREETQRQRRHDDHTKTINEQKESWREEEKWGLCLPLLVVSVITQLNKTQKAERPNEEMTAVNHPALNQSQQLLGNKTEFSPHLQLFHSRRYS